MKINWRIDEDELIAETASETETRKVVIQPNGSGYKIIKTIRNPKINPLYSIKSQEAYLTDDIESAKIDSEAWLSA